MFKKIIILAVMFFISPVSLGAETQPTDHLVTIKQSVDAFAKKNNISTAIVQIYSNGQPQTLYIGDAKATTTFDAGVLTEVMTGLLLAQQVDAAKVQLNTPIKQFSTMTGEDADKITLRSLATNTSGLPANAAGDKFVNEVDEVWAPSTVGMTLLNKALETSAHKSLAELYQKQIFTVIGMKTAKYSDGKLSMTAVDMQKFLAAAIGLPGVPEIISYPMRLTESAFVELPDRMIGLGWEINVHDNTETPSDNSVKEVFARPAFKLDYKYEKWSPNAYITMIPNKKAGIVILLDKPVSKDELAELGRELMAELS